MSKGRVLELKQLLVTQIEFVKIVLIIFRSS